MEALNYQFGAVDFIIQNPGEQGQPLKAYFIEWNLCPGWSLEAIKAAYHSSFCELEDLQLGAFQELADGSSLQHRAAAIMATTRRVEHDLRPSPPRRTHAEVLRDGAESVRQLTEQRDRTRQRQRSEAERLGREAAAVANAERQERALRVAREAVRNPDSFSSPDSSRFEPEITRNNFCHHCGRDIRDTDINFCPNCGLNVEA
jgi:hypothetical protein